MHSLQHRIHANIYAYTCIYIPSITYSIDTYRYNQIHADTYMPLLQNTPCVKCMYSYVFACMSCICCAYIDCMLHACTYVCIFA